jgi:hypothetical protein
VIQRIKKTIYHLLFEFLCLMPNKQMKKWQMTNDKLSLLFPRSSPWRFAALEYARHDRAALRQLQNLR